MLKRTFKWKRLLSCVLILALVMSFAPFAWALDENDLDNQVVNSVVEERDAIQNQPNQNDPDEFEEDIPDLTEDDAESHTVEVVPLEGELETPGEFVTDGSFEATAEFAAFEEEREPGNWYATGATISTSGARTGSKCARFTDANYTIEQDVEGLTIGETYYLSLWTQVGSGKVSLKIANYDGDKESSIQTKMAGGGYQNLTIPFTYKDEEKAPRISISTTGFMYSTTNVDDVSLTLDGTSAK